MERPAINLLFRYRSSGHTASHELEQKIWPRAKIVEAALRTYEYEQDFDTVSFESKSPSMSSCCIAIRAIQWTDSAQAPPLLQFLVLVFAHCRRTCIVRESHARRKSHDSIDPIEKQFRSEEDHLTALFKPFRLHGVLRRCRERRKGGRGFATQIVDPFTRTEWSS